MALSGVLSGGTWGVVVNDGQTVVTMGNVSMPIGGGVYFGLAVGAAVGLVMLHWSWWVRCQARRKARRDARSPTGRFRALAPLIDGAMAALEDDKSYEKMADGSRVLLGSAKSILRELILALEPLDIPHPPFAESTHRWGVFLSRLSAMAKRGSIARACSIWPDMEAERHG